MKTVKILNTGETVQNKFYFVETPGKIETQNPSYKTEKILALNSLYFSINNRMLPNFLQRGLTDKLIIETSSEFLLEQYRVNHFPNLPSRAASFFAFASLEDAQFYAGIEETSRHIFELEITSSDYKISKHNMEYVSVIRSYFYSTEMLEKENLYHKYWSGESKDFDYTPYYPENGIIKPREEYLIEGIFNYKLII